MTRYICVFMLNILVMFGLINSAFASSVANSFRLPLDDYQTNDGCLEWHGSNSYYPGTYHLADDVCDTAGTPVYAVANGVIKFASEYKPCGNWGYLIDIEHTMPDGSKVTSIYGHTIPENGIVAGMEVSIGQKVGEIGHFDCWSDHLHFGIYDGPYSEIPCSYNSTTNVGSCGTAGYMSTSTWPGNYLDPIQFVEDHQIPTDAYNAITAKADELWWIRPYGGNDCEDGLICQEPDGGDMHWYGGPTATNRSFIIEDWKDGVWGEIALTFDPSSSAQTEAYVLRHGFWNAYHSNGGPDVFGPPLGDEMDTTRTEYTPHDSYWGTNKTGAISNNCGPTNVFSSVQRFEEATMCLYASQVCLADPTADEGGEDLPFCCELTPYAKHICPSSNPSGYVEPEDQYLFIDTDQNGTMDPCLRRGAMILCDENRDGSSDYAFSYGDGISATYFPTRFGVAVVFNYGTFYLDDDADGYTNRTITFGTSGDIGHYLGNGGALAIQRYTRYFVIDNNADGAEEWFYPFGWGLSNQHYYLADMDGDNLTDLIFREGNLFYVTTNQDGTEDFTFTYGHGDTDDYYFADLDSDGTDEVIVRRGSNFYAILNQSISRTCPTCSNSHDLSFTYGNGL